MEPFQKHRHSRDDFSCEVESLERYFKTQAAQEVAKKVAAVFVLAEGRTVIGYYTLSSYTIDGGELPDEVAKHLPNYPKLPAILIGRLARDKKYARQGVGETLLVDALRRSLENTARVGAVAVVVEAENEKARKFYLDYGFIPFPGHRDKLFMPMGTIQKTFSPV
ncbi:MAG: GNAT family N-acetyltransferase [Acidobacteriia bacterium]|nr:GNAT family N-acetyltransferase [Terriglobia bacterium]